MICRESARPLLRNSLTVESALFPVRRFPVSQSLPVTLSLRSVCHPFRPPVASPRHPRRDPPRPCHHHCPYLIFPRLFSIPPTRSPASTSLLIRLLIAIFRVVVQVLRLPHIYNYYTDENYYYYYYYY